MTRFRSSPAATPFVLPLVGLALVACASSSGEPSSTPPRPGTNATPASAARNPKGVPEGLLQAKHEVRLGTRCGPQCAYVQSGQSLASLELMSTGRAEVRDEGHLLESFGSVAGDTEQVTTWTRAWVGSWKQNGQAGIAVELSPAAAECHREGAEGDAEPSCPPAKLSLECEVQTVTLRVDELSTARALVCQAPKPTTSLTISRLPWVFGVEEALLAIDFGRSHRPRRAYGRLGPAKKEKAQKP